MKIHLLSHGSPVIAQPIPTLFNLNYRIITPQTSFAYRLVLTISGCLFTASGQLDTGAGPGHLASRRSHTGDRDAAGCHKEPLGFTVT